MWKRYALVFLLFALSACSEFRQSIESGGLAPGPENDEGLLKQQVVNAQEQSARLEVRLSNFERKISSLRNEIHGLEAQQSRLEEKIGSLRREMGIPASSVSASPVSRARRSASPKKKTGTEKDIGHSSKRASKKSPRKIKALPSSTPGGWASSIVPKAPVNLKQSSLAPQGKRSSPTPQEAYSRAYRSIREKKNEKAILQFRDFLRRFPKNRLAANAQYWLGESYYDMRDFPTSLREFQKVISRYPASRKVPDAFYKKGITYLRNKNPRKAVREFEKLIKRYPNHSLAKKARKQLQTLNNAGNNKRR